MEPELAQAVTQRRHRLAAVAVDAVVAGVAVAVLLRQRHRLAERVRVQRLAEQLLLQAPEHRAAAEVAAEVVDAVAPAVLEPKAPAVLERHRLVERLQVQRLAEQLLPQAPERRADAVVPGVDAAVAAGEPRPMIGWSTLKAMGKMPREQLSTTSRMEKSKILVFPIARSAARGFPAR